MQDLSSTFQTSTSLMLEVMRDMLQSRYLRSYVAHKQLARTSLRTVPTFVIAHTFCASRDTRISYRRCLLIQGYFYTVQNYAEKAELSKRTWYSERKLGVTTHFEEIIKLEFGKERHTLLCVLKLFTISFEKCVVTPNFLFGFQYHLLRSAFPA